MENKDINTAEINSFKNNIDIINIITKLIINKYVIIICGPTGIGKSKIALILARIFDTNIISADSMQSYIGMDIGTDKQNFDKYRVSQYLVNICNPDHFLTSVEYRDRARKTIKNEFFDKGKVPIIAGGSGLHIRAIVDDLMKAPEGDYDLRKKIKNEITETGLQNYYEKLKQIDKEYADKIKANDERRIIRAFEVYRKTGKKYSDFQKKWHERKSIYNCIFIGLKMDRNQLYENIESRIDRMLDRGLLAEVKKLVENGYKQCYSLQQAIGYKELVKHLDGKLSLEMAIDEIKKNTRHLAKKQLTWLKADARINWITTDNYVSIYSLINEILSIILQQVIDEKN
ncbi:MAG: tRNA (adenosine(37)-N6)-dimethylallyltransferase MiaA [Actinomycetota bacterium]|nr:tRNA (adenosine(37)-N6)-dimethylallyltransferase MiaA [Actinomycetota bacterium]